MSESLVGKILHANWGYDCTLNDFCVVVKETQKTVVLAHLGRKLVSITKTDGMERPILLSPEEIANIPKEDIFRLHKGGWIEGSGRSYGPYNPNRRCFYDVWDGTDQYFNWR